MAKRRPAPSRDDEPIVLLRRGGFNAETYSEATATLECVASTFAPVQRRDARGVYLERLDPAGLDGSRLADAPVLDGHRQGSARDVIGTTRGYRVENGELIVAVRLSQADDVAGIAQRIREGVLRGVSLGYRVLRWVETVEAGQRIRTASAWQPFELSVVPVAADPGARFRSEDMPEVIETAEPTVTETRAAIRGIARSAGLPSTWADEQIDGDATVVEARAAAFEEMQTRQRQTPRIRVISPGPSPQDTLAAREEALYVRMAGGTPSDAARPFVADQLRDHARALVEAGGISTRGLNPDELFRAALHTTSDFPALLQGAGRRTLLASYTAAGSALKPLARQGTRSDFRTGSTIRLGELGALQKVSEAGEIRHVSRAEATEAYALDTFAALFSISRKALINDDLGAFNDWAFAAGQAAAQTEGGLLYGLLSASAGGGPRMSDGKALFHADHGNLMPAAALSEASLSEARLALRRQTGTDGKTRIQVVPKYLVVGPALETTAEKLLTAINANAVENVNPFGGKLTLSVEPRIIGTSWYLFADPASAPVFEYSYLSSAPGPQMSSREGWEVLSVEYRVVLDFGGGAIDWRGAVRNPGA